MHKNNNTAQEIIPTSNYDIMRSDMDASINFVRDMPVGKLEARFVQRTDEYFIVYLSSQTGCAKACRMCHLTATGQNKFTNASVSEFLEQADMVLNHYDSEGIQASKVHYNFMARGEPLDNPILLNESKTLLQPLANRAQERGIEYKFLISTIMPDTMRTYELIDIFPDAHLYPEIFYSIYSVDPRFRKRWLPRTLPVEDALGKMARWQEKTGKVPKIHFAFIEGENDSEESVRAVCQAILDVGLRVDFNIVRYNPYSEKYGRESSMEVIKRNVKIMCDMLEPTNHSVVTKVGFDVKASCGMFVS